MSWQSLLIVAVWGMLAAQLIIQACLFLILFVFALIGFVTAAEKVPRENNLAAMGASASGVVVFSLLFVGGLWIAVYLQLALSGTAAIVFWVCVAFSTAYISPQLPKKLRNGWRDTIHEDAIMRKRFENAKNFNSSAPPER